MANRKLTKVWCCLRVERIAFGMSQIELADAVGVSRQTVSAMEKGLSIPGLDLALRIAAVLHKPVESIFNLERKCPIKFH
ncbi:helix-turn-helix transcriptional regulator [Candidatus Uhrbacteria bacterium]|nr:helix-turn-helix transcriptional regulator [Candidatus Uhrbacteria bacterium]